MQYNISPETLQDTKHPSATVDRMLSQEDTFELYKDFAVCPNGAMYRKDKKGFLPELMEKMYKERVIFKKRMMKAKRAYEKTLATCLRCCTASLSRTTSQPICDDADHAYVASQRVHSCAQCDVQGPRCQLTNKYGRSGVPRGEKKRTLFF